MNTMSESNEAVGLQSMFFDPALSANPHPLFKQMRAMGSIVPIPAGFMMGTQQAWIVTQFEEAMQVLKDRRFTVDATTIDPNLRPFGRMAESTSAAPTFAQERTMINVDEPDHSRLRNLVSKAFTPRYIESLRPRIQVLADELLDRVQPQGTMDVVQDYAYPLPINVISDMLGVPVDYRAQIRHWSQIIAGNFADRSPERATQIKAYSEYIAQLVEEKRRNPQDDLISQLVQIEEAGDHLSERELVAMVDLLIFAGHET